MRWKGEGGRREDVLKARARKLHATRGTPSATHVTESIGCRPAHGTACGIHVPWSRSIHTLDHHVTSLSCTDGNGAPRLRMTTKPLPQPNSSSWGPGGGGGPEEEDLMARDHGPRGLSHMMVAWTMTGDGGGMDQGAHEGKGCGCNGSGTGDGEGIGTSGMCMGGPCSCAVQPQLCRWVSEEAKGAGAPLVSWPSPTCYLWVSRPSPLPTTVTTRGAARIAATPRALTTGRATACEAGAGGAKLVKGSLRDRGVPRRG